MNEDNVEEAFTTETITSGIFNELLSYITDLIKLDNSSKKIKEILSYIINVLLENISSYLYTIIILLIIIFIMNCSQFYYTYNMYTIYNRMNKIQ